MCKPNPPVYHVRDVDARIKGEILLVFAIVNHVGYDLGLIGPHHAPIIPC